MLKVKNIILAFKLIYCNFFCGRKKDAIILMTMIMIMIMIPLIMIFQIITTNWSVWFKILNIISAVLMWWVGIPVLIYLIDQRVK